jgi:4a-hydroxytetrahydrobiopterin dehydratase
MPGPERLSDQAIADALATLEGWTRDGDQITREFTFRDFVEAFGFLARAAVLQEKANHHAEYAGVYNRLRLTLSTHDSGGITQRDVDLARELNALLD